MQQSCDNPQCGKAFEQKKPWQRFCSARCREDYWEAVRISRRAALADIAAGNVVVISRSEYEALQSA